MTDSVASAYNQWSASYDSDHNATRDLDARVLRERGLPVRGARVLELGCGTGKNTEWLAEYALSIVAVDFSSGMIAKAQQRVMSHNVQFVHHDIRERLPLANHSFDLVVGNLVLEHIRDVVHVFAEAVRVLVPGGTFFCCELHPSRQQRGGQAHFTVPGSDEAVYVSAFTHSVAEFVNAGIAAGLVLVHLGEWLEDDASAVAPWRLLSLQFVHP